MCQSGDANQPLKQTGASEMKITTVGIDLAKNVFQVHGVNEFGKTVVKKQLRRDQVLRPALISSMSPTLFKGKSRGVSRSGLGGARTSVWMGHLWPVGV
jgi:transposase